jgi:heat shock protein HtpX
MNGLKTALLLGTLTGLMLFAGVALGGQTGLMVALVMTAVMNFGAYWFSDKVVLSMHGAQPVTREQAPKLYEIMEGLTAHAGLPMPKLYIVNSPAPNAFATGRNPSHAAVACTTGILEILDRNELEGVLAHELSHVANRDILSIAATLAGAISSVAWFAQWGAILGGHSRDNDRGGNPFAMLAMIIVAPIAAAMIQMAVSRSREFEADATGAKFAGNPYGLAGALQKLEDAAKRRPALNVSPTMSHLYISNPLSGRSFSTLFSTHPPLQERIRRLLGR